MAQQMSRGLCIKVRDLKGSSGDSNAENGLLKAKIRELKGQRFSRLCSFFNFPDGQFHLFVDL